MHMLQKMHALRNGGDAAMNAVTYDGVSDAVTRASALTGAVAGPRGTFHCWFRTTATGGAFIENSSGKFIFYLFSSKLRFTITSAGAARTLQYTSSAAYNDGLWHSLLVAWQTNNPAGNKSMAVYVDDVAAAGSIDDSNPAFTDITYGDGAWGIGNYYSGGNKFTGDLANVWFDFTTQISLATTAERRKFITAANKPVDLGAHGELPTGSSPIGFFNNPAATFGVNKGTGGDFTIAGALVDAAPPG